MYIYIVHISIAHSCVAFTDRLGHTLLSYLLMGIGYKSVSEKIVAMLVNIYQPLLLLLLLGRIGVLYKLDIYIYMYICIYVHAHTRKPEREGERERARERDARAEHKQCAL